MTGRAGRGGPDPGSTQILPEVVGVTGSVATSPLLADTDVSAVVVAVAPSGESEDGVQPRSGTVDASARYGIDLAELADRAGGREFTGAAGDVVAVDLPRVHGAASVSLPWSELPHRLILLGIGAGSDAELRRAGAVLAGRTRSLERVVSAVTAGAPAPAVRAFVEGYLLGAYRSPRWGTSRADERAGQLVLLGSPEQDPIDRATRRVRGTWLVRDLTTTPSNVKTPAWFAEQATRLADENGLDVQVLGLDALVEQGFGALVAVGAGSANGPRLAVVGHTPLDTDGSADRSRHVVIVGKGITYDTGGLSIKPREAMVPMKTDMAGAAVALATVLAAAQMGLPHRVTAVLPLAENHVGAASYRPGDVLRAYGGRTVEVVNTDAEGRLVLADALAFAVRTLDPDLLVDVATLTGAATLGLGRGHAALFATDSGLAAELEKAGAQTGERVWRMPLVEEYRSALRSDVADVRHVAPKRTGAGAITAALFLEGFVGSVPWAHLDIAGAARATSPTPESPEGATGYGARLLHAFLENLTTDDVGRLSA